MKDSLLFKIQLVEQLLSELIPLLNKFSSGAFFLQQGRLEYVRPAIQRLEEWSARYNRVLPEYVTREIDKLLFRLHEWTSSLGSSATPHNFATDDDASFHSLGEALRLYQETLYQELENLAAKEANVTIDRSFTVGAKLQNVNITGNVHNAFNATVSFGQSHPDSELRPKLEELCTRVNELVAQLPESQAQQVARDLENLVAEATSAQPRRKWYELSAEGILEASKTCASLVEPVSAAVRGVLGLLSTSGG